MKKVVRWRSDGHVHPRRRARRHLRGDLPGAHCDRSSSPTSARRQQVVGGHAGVHRRSRGDAAPSSSPSFQDRVLGPLSTGPSAWARSSPRPTTTTGSGTSSRSPATPPAGRVDRVTSLQVHRLRRRPRPRLLVTMLFGVGLLPTLGVCVLAVAGYMAPNMYLYQHALRPHPEDASGRLPDAIDLLTISVESGLGFDAALSQVARNTDGPLAEEFARVLQEMQIGMGAAPRCARSATAPTSPTCKGFVSRDGPGRRTGHPGGPGAARPVAGDPDQATAAGRGAGPEGGRSRSSSR